jgi:hypothetical protein
LLTVLLWLSSFHDLVNAKATAMAREAILGDGQRT